MATRVITEDGSRRTPTPPMIDKMLPYDHEMREMNGKETTLPKGFQIEGVRPSPSRRLHSAGGGRDLDAPDPGRKISIYSGDGVAEQDEMELNGTE